MAPTAATTVIFMLPTFLLPEEGTKGVDTVVRFEDGGVIVTDVHPLAVDLVGFYFNEVRHAPCDVTTFPNPHDALEFALGIGPWAE